MSIHAPPAGARSLPACHVGPARTPGRPPPLPIRPPWPWDWAHLDADGAEQTWAALEDFVGFLNRRYASSPDHLLPPCWAEHGALVEELTTLLWTRRSAFEAPTATPELAQGWHQYYLPGFHSRLRFWLGDDALKCRAGQHPAAADQDRSGGKRAARLGEVVDADVALRRSPTRPAEATPLTPHPDRMRGAGHE